MIGAAIIARRSVGQQRKRKTRDIPVEAWKEFLQLLQRRCLLLPAPAPLPLLFPVDNAALIFATACSSFSSPLSLETSDIEEEFEEDMTVGGVLERSRAW
jgi:hypothetical protein